MNDVDQGLGLKADLPRRPDLLLPVVGQTDKLGFPIRIADQDGATRLMQQRSLRFDFVAAGMTFETQGMPAENGTMLSIRARLGRLPFSTESKPARQEVFDLLSAPPPGAHAGVTGGNLIVLDGALSLQDKVTPVSLIAALTEWVVNVQPWLLQISQPLSLAGARQRFGV